jgi:DNA-binding HxlR family transcriptional regulator
MSNNQSTCVPEDLREAFQLLERRWQLTVLYAAFKGAIRFNEFINVISGISPRVLCERLQELEEAGLIQRCVTPTKPVMIEYRLTNRAYSLEPVINAVVVYTKKP